MNLGRMCPEFRVFFGGGGMWGPHGGGDDVAGGLHTKS